MEELKKKWFQIVWAGLLLVSIGLNYLQRWVDGCCGALVIRFVKSGGVLENVLPERWFNIFMFVVLSVGSLLYMIARYKFNNPNRD